MFLERDQMNSDALEPCIESGVRFAADEGNCRAARRVPLNFSNLSKRERERVGARIHEQTKMES